jgi:hypothetical protein
MARVSRVECANREERAGKPHNRQIRVKRNRLETPASEFGGVGWSVPRAAQLNVAGGRSRDIQLGRFVDRGATGFLLVSNMSAGLRR